MAGEKTTASRTTKRPVQTEPTITMTAEQMQEFMKEAFKSAMEATGGMTPKVKEDLNENLSKSLAARINERDAQGRRFFEHMADPRGPRKRIVIDKIYREFAGSQITATVNGNTVKVPVDGQPHDVHPAHYAAIKTKLQYLSSTRDRATEAPDMFGDDVGDYAAVNKG